MTENTITPELLEQLGLQPDATQDQVDAAVAAKQAAGGEAAKGTRYMVLYAPCTDDGAPAEGALDTRKLAGGYVELGWVRAWAPERAKEQALVEARRTREGFEDQLRAGVKVRAVPERSWADDADVGVTDVYVPEPELRIR